MEDNAKFSAGIIKIKKNLMSNSKNSLKFDLFHIIYGILQIESFFLSQTKEGNEPVMGIPK